MNGRNLIHYELNDDIMDTGEQFDYSTQLVSVRVSTLLSQPT